MKQSLEQIVVIGVEGPVVDKISATIKDTPTAFKKTVGICSNLNAYLSKVDEDVFNVLVLDMTSLLSLDMFRQFLKECNPSTNRSIAVFVNAETPSRYAFGIDESLELCETNNVDYWFCTITDEVSVKVSARAVLKENAVVT